MAKRPSAPLPAPPNDLEAFWRGRHERARAIIPRPHVVRDETAGDGIRTLEINFTSTDGMAIGAWVTLPEDSEVDRGIVFLHGYSGLQATDISHPALNRTAVIWPCLRGMGELSKTPELPSVGSEHVLFGIESRDSYIHGGCVDDTWNAISALTALLPDAAGRIDLIGRSFGGGIGAMATAWDPRIRSAVLRVPSFGNHPVRVTTPCTGSGNAIRERWLQQPQILEILAYFDAATCAGFIDVPVLVAPALVDPAVPPAGQWSIYDAVKSPKQLFPFTAGHTVYPGDEEQSDRFEAESLRFMKRQTPALST